MQIFIYCKNHSTCFGCSSHSSSGVHKIETAASGVPDDGYDGHPKHVD